MGEFISKSFFVILLAPVLFWFLGPVHAATPSQKAALVIEIKGPSYPTVLPLEELFVGSSIKLSRGSIITFSHYKTCEKITIKGGELKLNSENFTVFNGYVVERLKEECPKILRLNNDEATSAGVRLREIASEKRVALVIGNGTYPNVGELPNPPNDAKLMSETLRALDFDVIERVNVGQKDMKRAIKLFGTKLEAAGKDAVGLFYFAGHGVQVRGINYLIPVNVDIEDEADVDIEAVSARAIQEQMRYAGNRLNVIVMDACRNNPFKRSFRSASRGLARMDATKGTLIAYATSPGDVAADGSGENSPYTEALSKALLTPGLTVERIFKEVRNSVVAATNNRQIPWEASSLTGGDFYFKAKPVQVAASIPSAPSTSTEVLVWNSIKDSSDPATFRGYLKQYPTGIFAAIATEKLQSAERVQEERLEAERQRSQANRQQQQERLAAELEAARTKAAADAQAAAQQQIAKVLAEERKRAAEALKATTDAELKRIREGAKMAALNPNVPVRTSIQGDWDLQLTSSPGDSEVCGFDKRNANLSVKGDDYTFEFIDVSNTKRSVSGKLKNNRASAWFKLNVKHSNLLDYQQGKFSIEVKDLIFQGSIFTSGHRAGSPCILKISEK